MPALEHWLGSATLLAVFTAAFGLVLGIIGIKDLVAKWPFALLISFGAILVAFTWYVCARQAEQSARAVSDAAQDAQVARNSLAGLSGKLDAVLEQLAKPISQARAPELSQPPAPRSPDAKELARRGQLLDRLRGLYILSHDNITSEMIAGFELPPVDWLNGQLEKQGEPWRIRSVKGTTAETYEAPRR